MIDLAFAILAATLLVYHVLEARSWSRERAQLLDRLMARNWGEYVAGVRAVDESDTPQLTTDAIEAAWYSAKEREMAEAV